MSKSLPERVLAINLLGLGNLMLAAPALRALAEKLGRPPDLALRGRSAQRLVEQCRLAERVHLLPPGRLGLLKLARACRAGRYNAALLCFPGGRAATLLARLSNAPLRVGHTVPGRMGALSGLLTRSVAHDLDVHDVQRNLRLVAALLGQEPTPTTGQALNLPQSALDAAQQYMANHGLEDVQWIGVHPGSDPAFRDKRWPAAHYAALADLVWERLGLGTLVLDGPDEAAEAQQIKLLAHGRIHALHGELDVLDTAALILRCRAIVANDSGIMHLACALDAPVVALFGPSEPGRAAPWSVQSRMVLSELECAPCHGLAGHRQCPHDRQLCLEQIEPETVFAALCDLLDQVEQGA